MSTANATKIFGIRVGLDPKLLLGGLIALAGLLYWFNTRGEESVVVTSSVANPTARAGSEAVAPQPQTRRGANRRTAAANDRGVLRLRPVDATRGDVDPTLRLDLLARLSAVEQGKIGRSLFEIGPAPQEAAGLPIKAPKIPVSATLPTIAPGTPPAPVVNVPLKYYGYAKPQDGREANRGLFLDGDNIVVAVEGQTVKGRYLVVELTPTRARMEDTQLRQSQDLPVMPVAQQ